MTALTILQIFTSTNIFCCGRVKTPMYGQISWGYILAKKFVTFCNQLWALMRAQKTKLWGSLSSIVLSHEGTVIFVLQGIRKNANAISFGATAIAQYIYQNNTSAIKERPQETSYFTIFWTTSQTKKIIMYCPNIGQNFGCQISSWFCF